MTLQAIAEELNLSKKTLIVWKKAGNWESKREQYLKESSPFPKELYNITSKLMQSVTKDMVQGEKPCQMSLYALARILPLIFKFEECGGNLG